MNFINTDYQFNMKVAQKYGFEESLLIRYFQYWIDENKRNNKNFHDNIPFSYYFVSIHSFSFLKAYQRVLFLGFLL